MEATAALVALLIRQEWFCASPLETRLSSALELSFALSASGEFDGYGIVAPLGTEERFEWSGSWTLLDGQVVMIGATQGQTFGVAPTGELRAMAQVTEADVIVFDASSQGGPTRTLRCLTHKLD